MLPHTWRLGFLGWPRVPRGWGSLQIAVAAYSGEPELSRVRETREFVKEVSRLCPGAVLVLGGYRGLMRLVADEARARGLGLVFVIPSVYEDDEFPDGSVVVRTGMGVRERSTILVRSGSVLASLGGGIGTLYEELIACSLGIPVFRLVMGGEELLTERLTRCMPDGVLDSRLSCRIAYVTRGRELAQSVCEAAVNRP